VYKIFTKYVNITQHDCSMIDNPNGKWRRWQNYVHVTSASTWT